MFILVKLGGFHAMMNGRDATGYIMAGFGLRRASDGNLCNKHYSKKHFWPVTTVHSGPVFSSLQPSITSLPQPPAPWIPHLLIHPLGIHQFVTSFKLISACYCPHLHSCTNVHSLTATWSRVLFTYGTVPFIGCWFQWLQFPCVCCNWSFMTMDKCWISVRKILQHAHDISCSVCF